MVGKLCEFTKIALDGDGAKQNTMGGIDNEGGNHDNRRF